MKLSICIPTYNRKDTLEVLIASISRQRQSYFDIEVCISDNASTDDTVNEIEKWREKYSLDIVYKNNGVNLGPDRNFIASVDMAKGDYCWLFGSDDVLADDAFLKFYEVVSSQADIYLCDRIEYNSDLSLVTDPHRRWLMSESYIFHFHNSADLIDYYNKCNGLGGTFSYLSSLIIKNSCWKQVFHSGDFFGTAYSHVFYVLSILGQEQGCRLHYIAEPLVKSRGDNDFFAKNGIAKRIFIDLNGYTKLADYFYAMNRQVKSAFLSVLQKERPWLYTSLVIGKYSKDKKIWNDAARCYEQIGKSFYLTKIIFNAGDIVYSLYNIKLVRSLFRYKMGK